MLVHTTLFILMSILGVNKKEKKSSPKTTHKFNLPPPRRSLYTYVVQYLFIYPLRYIDIYNIQVHVEDFDFHRTVTTRTLPTIFLSSFFLS